MTGGEVESGELGSSEESGAEGCNIGGWTEVMRPRDNVQSDGDTRLLFRPSMLYSLHCFIHEFAAGPA